MSKPLAKIDNWSVVDDVISPAYRELAPGRRLTGDVSGHGELPSGIIYTSAILSVDETRGLVETLNTIYQLGAVSTEYARWERRNRAAYAA